MSYFGALVSCLVFVTLAGCVSGTSSPTNQVPIGVLSSDAGTMGQALDAGAVLSTTVRTARGIQVNVNSNRAAPVDTSLTLQKGADGKFTMTLNGEVVTFDGTDTVGANTAPTTFEQATINGGRAAITSLLTNNLADLGDPATLYYSYPIRASVTQQDGTESFVYAVLGTETLPSALAGLPSANYVGQAVMESLAEVQTSTSGSQTAIANFALRANFGKGEVFGSVSNWFYFNPATGKFDDPGFGGARFVLERTAIVRNGYQGNLTFDPGTSGNTSVVTGAYAGTFFGPAANETGGTFWFLYETPDANGQTVREHGVGEFNSDPTP